MPTRVTWIAGVGSVVIAGPMPIARAAELTSTGILPAFIVVCVAVIVLRYLRPDLPRSFRVSGMPVVPIIGVVFRLWLITFLSPITWLRLVVWCVIGLTVYGFYGHRHSLLHPTRSGSEDPAA